MSIIDKETECHISKNILQNQFPLYNPEWAKYNKRTEYHRYYNVHIKYVLNLLVKGGVKLDMVSATNFEIRSHLGFDCIINGYLCRFDFNDHEECNLKNIDKYKIYFKFHYNYLSSYNPIIYPFSPVNFHEWDLYERLLGEIKYKATGKVLNNQLAHGNAINRRNMVSKILTDNFNEILDRNRYPTETFFKLINSALVIVCVPGARNNMLDRGQFQQMAFGACTISPKLVTCLSYHKKLIPDVHYIECKSDYSDLVEKIKWVMKNKDMAIHIGNNAKELFLQTSTPDKQIEWINACLNKVTKS
jgi:hypothetical protein